MCAVCRSITGACIYGCTTLNRCETAQSSCRPIESQPRDSPGDAPCFPPTPFPLTIFRQASSQMRCLWPHPCFLPQPPSTNTELSLSSGPPKYPTLACMQDRPPRGQSGWSSSSLIPCHTASDDESTRPKDRPLPLHKASMSGHTSPGARLRQHRAKPLARDLLRDSRGSGKPRFKAHVCVKRGSWDLLGGPVPDAIPTHWLERPSRLDEGEILKIPW